jgi:hypothetical protein
MSQMEEFRGHNIGRFFLTGRAGMPSLRCLLLRAVPLCVFLTKTDSLKAIYEQ